MAEVQAGAKRKKTTRDAAPEATAASENAAAAQEAAAETGTLPALDNNAILTFLEDAVQSLYGELRHSTQALNRAAQILALGESRVLEIPYFDYPFRFRLPYVSTDRTMGAMLARCEFPNAANLASPSGCPGEGSSSMAAVSSARPPHSFRRSAGRTRFMCSNRSASFCPAWPKTWP